jgi:hypothetical protein
MFSFNKFKKKDKVRNITGSILRKKFIKEEFERIGCTLGQSQLACLKGVGIFCTYYTYIAVFNRNAANLTLLLLKGLKT